MYYEVNISLFGLCVISGVADIRFSTKVLTNLSSFQLYLCLRQRKHLPCNLAIFNILFFPQHFSASAPLPLERILVLIFQSSTLQHFQSFTSQHLQSTFLFRASLAQILRPHYQLVILGSNY